MGLPNRTLRSSELDKNLSVRWMLMELPRASLCWPIMSRTLLLRTQSISWIKRTARSLTTLSLFRPLLWIPSTKEIFITRKIISWLLIILRMSNWINYIKVCYQKLINLTRLMFSTKISNNSMKLNSIALYLKQYSTSNPNTQSKLKPINTNRLIANKIRITSAGTPISTNWFKRRLKMAKVREEMEIRVEWSILW